MNKHEKEILKKVVDYKHGPVSSVDMVQKIAGGDSGILEKFMSAGYLSERSRIDGSGGTVFHYRVSEKGLLELLPLYKKFWFNVKSDFRNIVVSAITAVVVYLLLDFIG